jgi:hypothetical protein
VIRPAEAASFEQSLQILAAEVAAATLKSELGALEADASHVWEAPHLPSKLAGVEPDAYLRGAARQAIRGERISLPHELAAS